MQKIRIAEDNQAPDFLLRCTSKLARELRVKMDTADDYNVMDERHWQGNIFTSNRRKCLIFTHALTLYSFFILRVVRKDFIGIQSLFKRHLQMNLESDGLIHPMIIPPDELSPSIVYAKSQNASLLASMNNLVLDARAHLEMGAWEDWEEVQKVTDSTELGYLINRTPMGIIGYDFPVDRMRGFIVKKQAENAG